MKSLLVTCIILLNVFSAFSGNFSGGSDPLEKRYIKDNKVKPDVSYQAELRKSTAWQNFRKSNNNNWSVEFNESTQLPHRAYGEPIQASGNNPEAAAMNFINTNLNEWHLPVGDLKLQTVSTSSKYHNVIFYQTYNGLDVLDSRIYIKMTKDFRVNTWGLDAYKINISTTPALDINEAVNKAKVGINTPVTAVSTPKLKILPVPEGRSITAHLVYELTVSTKTEENAPSNYYTLVDANTGELLYRHDKVNYFSSLNTDIHVASTLYKFNPYIAPANLPLRNLKAVVGGITYHTDSLGNLSAPTTTPLFGNFYLEGTWCRIVTDAGTTTPQVFKSFTTTSDSITFDATTSIRHISGYYHVNEIHDFMKSCLPTFTWMDNPLLTRIDVVGGFCNAFYSGSDINFFESGGGCNCMSQIGDVVYHEYGHGINDKFYQSKGSWFANSGMNEGYADVWAFCLTKMPTIGSGTDIGNPNSYIRRYDGFRKVYPANMSSDPHDVGEIIAGAWYDTRINLNSWQSMIDIYVETFNDLVTGPDGTEGQLFSDILLAALNADDDDANLSNGTPHDNEILDAFALHGIYLLNNATFEHQPIYSVTGLSPVTVTADLDANLPWLGVTFNLFYRTDNTSAYTSIPMTLVSGSTYSADIPQQPAGTVISYYLKLEDGFTTALKVMPVEADSLIANIPYFILVNCVRNQIDDFDLNHAIGWQTGITGDNATGGQWIIAPPVPSFTAGDTCQVGLQHTQGGANCAVTGNATSPSFTISNSDVDGGMTTLQSPTYDLTGMIDPVVTYWRWYTNDQGSSPRTDYWKTYISGDGINYVLVESCGVPDHSWRRFAFKVSEFNPGATNMTLRFVAEDTNPGSVVEVALDDVEILNSDLGNGINDPELENLISIYPSPASNYLNINISSSRNEEFQFDVVDNIGKIVLSKKSKLSAGNNSESLNISNLENGIYHLVAGSNGKRVEKVFSVLK